MKITFSKITAHLLRFQVICFLFVSTVAMQAHLIGEDSHDHAPLKYDFTVRPPTIIRMALANSKQPLLASAESTTGAVGSGVSTVAGVAAAFAPFAPKVKTHADEKFLYVESDGLPMHNMMVGITSWQQQVPLPQNYSGDNAWRIPLAPVPSKNPASIKGQFLRGAIALAANGIPIFNPQNNRGEISQEIGELDEWGGHCGRADDYHYHAAPLHLQSVLGKSLPIAYALDGYPMYGLNEPDGTSPAKLDTFNGHETSGLGYHYHGSTKYPYVNGGFHGEVVEKDGQVDPQPRAQSTRGAGAPLRGARITGFTSPRTNNYSLQYQLGGETRYVNYELNPDKTARFDFVDGNGKVRTENYSRQQRGGGDRPPRDNGNADRNKREPEPRNANELPRDTTARQPWMKVHGKEMDANSDGSLTRAELTAEIEKVFAGYDKNKDGKLARDEYESSGGIRSAMGGFVKQHAREIDADSDKIITKNELTTTAARMFDKTDLNHDDKLGAEELVLPPGYKPTPPDGAKPRSDRKNPKP